MNYLNIEVFLFEDSSLNYPMNHFVFYLSLINTHSMLKLVVIDDVAGSAYPKSL